MQSISYAKILQNLDNALRFCRSLGLDVEHSRFMVYRQRILELIQAIAHMRQTGTTPALPEGITDLEYIVALTESTEFGDFLPYLQACESAPLREKLARILTGPVLPSDEDETSNRARNLLFELNLAARLWRAGVTPVLGEHPDLKCDVNGKTLFLECKRPFSSAKVPKRIKQAGKQLRTDLKKASPGARGVIAISFSKILNPGDKLLVVAEEARGREDLEITLQREAEKYREHWMKFYGTYVVGIMFHIITPAIDKAGNKYAVGQQLDVYPLADDSSSDYKVFRAVGYALERVQY